MLPLLKLDGLKPSSLRRPVYVSAFPFTHHRVKLRVFRQPRTRDLHPSQRWFPADALHAIPIPSPHRRAINALLLDWTIALFLPNHSHASDRNAA